MCNITLGRKNRVYDVVVAPQYTKAAVMSTLGKKIRMYVIELDRQHATAVDVLHWGRRTECVVCGYLSRHRGPGGIGQGSLTPHCALAGPVT